MKCFVWEEAIKVSEEHWPPFAKLHDITSKDINDAHS